VAPVVEANEDMTESFILSKGLSLVGFPSSRQKVRHSLNVERFRSFYGVGPKAATAILKDLEKKAEMEISHFFMTLNWLRLYDTEHVLSGRWGLSEETIRNQIKSMSEAIQSLKERKIVWGDFDDDEVFIITVDGVHCRINEPRNDPGSKWYDHKSNSAGVSYEVTLAIRSDRVVSISGPFPASIHDLTMFRGGKVDEPKDPNALQFRIPHGKKAIADSAYGGEAGVDDKVSITRQGDSSEVKAFKARAKARHESFNSRLKAFQVLDLAFRHGFRRHKIAFECVCIICQYDLENDYGLFEI
jgi:hypothetical protein